MSPKGPAAAERVRAFFFGRDVFISYSYVDSAYAEALAVALHRLRFSVFTAAWGVSPGEKLSPGVSNAARQSRLLVVIATPASRASVPVEEEIRFFADRTRSVIPVDLGLGIRETKTDWPALEGTDVIREPHPETKRPSRPVIRRIRNAATFTRQTARLKRFIAAVFAIVALVIAGATMWSRMVVQDAQAQVARAEQLADTAREGAAAANIQRIRANILASAANLQTFFARLRTRSATQQAQFAEADRRIAAANAEREAAIGSYIRMANDATAMLDMQPARVKGAALQAVQAVRFLEKRGTRAPAADRILRQTLELLPYVDERTVYQTTYDWNAPSTPDGRWIADRVSDELIAVVNTDTAQRQTFPLPVGQSAKLLALSDDGTALAAFSGKTRFVVSVWNIADGQHRDVPLSSNIDQLAVSDGGTFLAVHTSRSEIAIVRVADAQVVAATARTASVVDLAFTRGNAVAITGGANVSGMWAWQATETPTAMPAASLIVRHPELEEVIAIVGDGLTVRNWRSGKELWSAPREVHRSIHHAAFSNSGDQLAFLSAGQGYIVNWRQPENLASFALRAGSVRIMPINQNAALVSYEDGSVDWHEPTAAPPVLARAVHDAAILRMVPQANNTVRTISTAGALTWVPDRQQDSISFSGERKAAAVSPDGSLIVSLSPRKADLSVLRIRDENGWAPMHAFPHDWTAMALGTGKSFYVGLRDGSVLRWKDAGEIGGYGVRPEIIARGDGPIAALAVGRDGWVAFASGGGVWTAGAGRVNPIHREAAAVTALAFGSSNDLLAAGTAAGEVHLWRQGQMTTFRRQQRIESVAISADGRFVAATAHPHPAAVWHVDHPSVARELPGDPATAIAFHPTDGTIATGGQSGVVQVWSNWQHGRPVEAARFSSGSFVHVLRFTDDGRLLVSVPRFGAGALWVWKSEELVADTCERLRPVRNTGDAGGFDVICSGY